MADPRGEVTLEIGGRAYIVRPTFRVISGIEQALGRGCIALGVAVTSAQIGVHELANIIFQALRHEKNAPKLDDIGEEILDRGMTVFIEPVGELLLHAVQGHSEMTGDSEDDDPGEVETPSG